MNSQERREGRYQRRKAKRNRPGQHIKFEDVFTMQNLQQATNDCRKNVMWKQDPITYTTHAPVSNKRLKDDLLSGRPPKCKKIRCKDINERGKLRHIRMVDFGSRVAQRCHCDNALIPALTPGLIYDNMASQKNKGVSRARKRTVCHIEKGIREYGIDNTCVMTLDLTGFFDSISHRLCLNVLSKTFRDKMIIGLTMYFIKLYHKPDIEAIKDRLERAEYEEKLKNNQASGCTLGSEISQVMAIAAPNSLDHFVKEKLGIKHFIRYMDDMFFVGTKEMLLAAYKQIKIACTSLGFRINEKKTKICSVRKSFSFLKIRYFVTGSGEVVRRLTRANVVRQRQKLKRFHHLVSAGKMALDDVFESMQSWLGHARNAKSWHARKRMVNRYCLLFDGYRKEELVF